MITMIMMTMAAVGPVTLAGLRSGMRAVARLVAGTGVRGIPVTTAGIGITLITAQLMNLHVDTWMATAEPVSAESVFPNRLLKSRQES